MEIEEDGDDEEEAEMLSLKLRIEATNSNPCSRMELVANRTVDINAAATPMEMIAEEEEGGERSSWKKLRLTLQQSVVLEDCFRHHATLSLKKKVELAKTLNLKPRQVEVWFQNSRARTKLKQTEVDYAYFRQCCEALTRENLRLQREHSLKPPPHLCIQVPATTLVVCSSCEREKEKVQPS